MRMRFVLLASVSAGVLATPAAAAPRHKDSTAEQVRSMAAELEELRGEVRDLQQRLSEQVATQSQAQSAATAAATQASAAAERAQASAAAAQAAVPTEVAAQVAKLPKAPPPAAPSTVISGRSYINFSHINQHVNGVASANNGTGFNIKRFYLGIDHKFSDVFSANLTTDVSNVIGQTSNNNFATPTANTTTGAINNEALVGRGLYIKKAYLQAKLNPALIIRAGSADLPWIPYVEGIYPYRYVENTLIDRTGFGTSADWGFHVLGDLAHGLISYQVSVVDGGGYRNVKVTNSVDFEGRVSAQYKGFYGALGGYSGKRAADVQNATTYHTATRFNALAGYKNALFNLGGEYFRASDWNNVATLVSDRSEGYSLFGAVNPIPKWSAFGRYDWVKPNDLTNTNLRDHYFNLGVQYEPVKIVDIALVYKRDVANNGLISTSNGTIGGANPAGTLVGGRGTYDEIGLFGQFRF